MGSAARNRRPTISGERRQLADEIFPTSVALSFRVAHASRVLAMTSRQRGLSERLFRRDAETNTRDACATPSKEGRFPIALGGLSRRFQLIVIARYESPVTN